MNTPTSPTKRALHSVTTRLLACAATAAPIALFIALFITSQSAHAADSSCKAVAKAGDAALANTRIHQALYMPMMDKSARPPATEKMLAHFIVIDKTKFTAALSGNLFDAEPITKPSDRSSNVYYASMLASMDEDCRALGKATLGGRAALVFEQGANKKTEDIMFKIWIDSATGLPLRADVDEAQVVSSMTKNKNGMPVFSAKKSDSGKRQVNSVAFLFGDAVKAPTFNTKKNDLGVLNLLGKPGTIDPQAMATLLALLN